MSCLEKKGSEIMNERINDIVAMMDEILDDKTVPRNVKKMIQKAKELLLKEGDLELRKDASIHALEDIDDDPNIPMFTRTSIWNIISMLESL